jgi:hypothetical protein
MIYRLTVKQDWRDAGCGVYDFSTLRDAETARNLLGDVTEPMTDDLFCSSTIDLIP